MINVYGKMVWEPKVMLLYDVYSTFGSLENAGLRRIGKERGNLILTFLDGSIVTVKPRESIPLPYNNKKLCRLLK